MSNVSSQAVIIDIGSGLTKAGMSDAPDPTVEIPTIVAKIKDSQFISETRKAVIVGEDLTSGRSLYNITHPVQHGLITSWDDFELIISHIYHEQLRRSPTSSPLLLAISPKISKDDREKIVQILFDKYSVPACYIVSHPALSLSQSGESTGIVVDMGYDSISINSIIDENASSQIHLGGHDLTDYMLKILAERGYTFTTPQERESVEDIKKEKTYVASSVSTLSFEHEMVIAASSATFGVDYELPDGEKITIGNEQFRCPEAIFQPSHLGMDEKGIHDIIVEHIDNVVTNIRNNLYNNIYLCGGSSLFKNLQERLKIELGNKVGSTQEIIVTARPKRQYSVWAGATSLISQTDFLPKWITREEYDREGPSVVHRKCNR